MPVIIAKIKSLKRIKHQHPIIKDVPKKRKDKDNYKKAIKTNKKKVKYKMIIRNR